MALIVGKTHPPWSKLQWLQLYSPTKGFSPPHSKAPVFILVHGHLQLICRVTIRATIMHDTINMQATIMPHAYMKTTLNLAPKPNMLACNSQYTQHYNMVSKTYVPLSVCHQRRSPRHSTCEATFHTCNARLHAYLDIIGDDFCHCSYQPCFMFCSRIHVDRIDAVVSRELVEQPTPWPSKQNIKIRKFVLFCTWMRRITSSL